ncbi:MAG: hypothetical protein SCH72_01580 [Desulfuromonadales bacterium]|nr:hypothetical protein [Desulfuromonadales bacterium]
MNFTLSMDHISLVSFALLANLPLGYLRQRCRKYSLRWFIYIHLSIPFIATWRLTSDISWKIIPFTLAAAIAGQLLGGRIYHRKRS